MAMFSQAKIHWKDDEHQKVGHPSESKMSKTKGIRNKLEVFANDKPYSRKTMKWGMHGIMQQIPKTSFTTFTNKTALFHIIPYSFLPTKPIRIQTLILDSFDIQFCSTFPHHIRGSLRCWRSLRPPGQRSAGAIGALDGIDDWQIEVDGSHWFTLVYIGLYWFTRHSYYSWRVLIVDS